MPDIFYETSFYTRLLCGVLGVLAIIGIIGGCGDALTPESDPQDEFVVTEQAEPAAAEPTGCHCGEGCTCGELCECAETGTRCSFDCTCAAADALYCCETCGECRRYHFPAGRPCEPEINCPECGGLQQRNDRVGVQPTKRVQRTRIIRRRGGM